jgi:hypothetical protein
MNVHNITNYTNNSMLSSADLNTLAQSLLTECKEVQYAYGPYWNWVLAELGSELPVPKGGADWTLAPYRQGIAIWLKICEINKWA